MNKIDQVTSEDFPGPFALYCIHNVQGVFRRLLEQPPTLKDDRPTEPVNLAFRIEFRRKWALSS